MIDLCVSLQEGYLDGMDAGKENSLQTGFNLGYKLGVVLLLPCGELRGTLRCVRMCVLLVIASRDKCMLCFIFSDPL